MPKRIQRKRAEGWRMPPNTISVTRPGRFGNPFIIGESYHDAFLSKTVEITLESCLELFRLFVKGKLAADPDWLKEVRGKDVACFCKVSEPCHGDILLEYANK